MRISLIAKIKLGVLENLIPVAQEVKDTLGTGGSTDPDAIIEERIGFTNTPVSNRYFRSAFDPAYATALEWIKENGGTETVDLIGIEWEGQKMFQTGVDANGNPENLGMIGNVAVYHEPIEGI